MPIPLRQSITILEGGIEAVSCVCGLDGSGTDYRIKNGPSFLYTVKLIGKIFISPFTLPGNIKKRCFNGFFDKEKV